MIENLSEILIDPYTNLIGDFFWAFWLFLAVGVIYLRTKNFTLTTFVLLIGSSVLAAVLPGGTVRIVMFFAAVFAIAAAFYRLFVRRTNLWGE